MHRQPGGLGGIQLGGLGVEVCRGLLRVAIGRGPGVVDVDAQELRTHRLDLLPHLGARVEGAHHGAERAGGADRGEARDPGPHDEHRHLTGEERAELVCRLDHRAVAPDVGHRGEDVQGLGAGDARHGIHRQRGDTAGGEPLDEVGAQGRGEQGDEHLALAEPLDLGRVGSVDLQDHVRVPHGVPDHVGAGPDVGGVLEAGGRTRPFLHEHGVAEPDELLDGARRRGRPALTRP